MSLFSIIICFILVVGIVIFVAILMKLQEKVFNEVKEGDVISYNGKRSKVLKKNKNTLIIETEIPWHKINRIIEKESQS